MRERKGERSGRRLARQQIGEHERNDMWLVVRASLDTLRGVPWAGGVPRGSRSHTRGVGSSCQSHTRVRAAGRERDTRARREGCGSGAGWVWSDIMRCRIVILRSIE